MKLSILIPSYNMSGKIGQCLDSIYKDADDSQFEVIVCDSSDDSSMEEFKQWCMKHKNLKVVHSKKRLAAGTARNIACQQAVGDYVYCVDIDDRLHEGALPKILEKLDGKDAYICPYMALRGMKPMMLKGTSREALAKCPVAVWSKVFRRQLYVNMPPYMPEDVWPHFVLADRCNSVGYFDFIVYDYDNTIENSGAISRTFDWLLSNSCSLLQLFKDGTLAKLGLREEFIAGVLHNLADMWGIKDQLKNEDVKHIFQLRFQKEYQNFMSGCYVH